MAHRRTECATFPKQRLSVGRRNAGFGNGQFSSPLGVAVDSAGNVYVADTGNNRIVQMSGAAPVPEPATLMLLGSGWMYLFKRRRRPEP